MRLPRPGHLRRPIAAVALGALTAWLIAWGVALTAPNASGGGPQWWFSRASSDAWSWYVTPRSSFGHRAFVFRVARDEGETAAPSSPRLPGWAMVDRTHMRTDAQGFGWPWPCARLVTGRGGGEHDGLALGRRSRLPLTPIWPGLLADAMLWGAAWWAAAWGWGTAVRRRRRRRGRCTRCGYEVEGFAVCPECGTFLAKPRSTVPPPA